MNICRELRCPFNDSKNGCREFITSHHCPLGFFEGEIVKRNPAIQPNEYWLFADDCADININRLRQRLETEVLAKSVRLTSGNEKLPKS